MLLLIPALVGTVVALYIVAVWWEWKDKFSRRPSQRDPQSPSFHQPPLLVTFLNDEAKSSKTPTDRKQQRRRRSSSSLRTPRLPSYRDLVNSYNDNSSSDLSERSESSASQELDNNNKKQQSEEKVAPQLDIDHVRIPFLLYLLTYSTTVTAVMAQILINLVRMRIEMQLEAWGLYRPKARSLVERDFQQLCAQIFLETGFCIYYTGKVTDSDQDDDKNKNVVARFFIPNAALANHKTKQLEWVDVEAYIHLGSCTLERAYLRGSSPNSQDDNKDQNEQDTASSSWEPIAPKEFYAFLCIFSIFTHHTKVHAFANWGVNLEWDQVLENPWQAWCSAVTVTFNNLGYHSFSANYWLFKLLGGVSSEQKAIWHKQCIHMGLLTGVPHHAHVGELAKYSRFVRFMIDVRPTFMKLFNKYKSGIFPEMDGEAFFVGTLVHSVEHSTFRQITSPVGRQALDVPPNSCYRWSAELARVINSCFLQDFCLLPFSPKFRDATHPFYQGVYCKAKQVDAELADFMETCVVK